MKSKTTGIHPAPFLREAGLLGGRPWWRSRLALCVGLIVLALLVECIVLGWHLRLWGRMPMRSVPSTPEYLRAVESPLLPVAVGVAQAVSAAALLLPLWLTARAWARDRDPATIDQLRVLPVDHDSFTGAKLLWMQIFYAACFAAYFIRLPVHWVSQIGDVHHSVLWFIEQRSLGPSSDELREQLMPHTWFGLMESLGNPWFVRFLAYLLALSWTLAAFGWIVFWAPRIGSVAAFAVGTVVIIALPLGPTLAERLGAPRQAGSGIFFAAALCWIAGCLLFLPLAARREQRLFSPPDEAR